MSTTFGINAVITDADNKVIRYIQPIARRFAGKINFTNNVHKDYPDTTKVIAMDNSPQGIYTIGDIKRAIETGDICPEDKPDLGKIQRAEEIEERYDYTAVPMNPNSNVPNCIIGKPSTKQFIQFEPELFKKYIAKFNAADKMDMLKLLAKEFDIKLNF